jgi:ribonuclease-3
VARSRQAGSKALNARRIQALEHRIGHTFKSHETLIRALTHSSAAAHGNDRSHYERLEFLGDRVLGLCVANRLFEMFPGASEGELSVRLNALVSGETCTEIADEMGLADFITTGADARQINSKRMRSVRADVVESLIAAIYRDAGLDAAKAFVARFWEGRFDTSEAAVQDSKTALQEWAHAEARVTPSYEIVSRSGPDHDPVFTVAVTIEGRAGAEGQGRSKRTAEQEAARNVLEREGVWDAKKEEA